MRHELRALAVARILLGLVFLFRTTPLANVYPSPLCWVDGPLFGWPVAGWHAAWLGWTLPACAVEALCVARTLAAASFTLGVATRASGLTASGCGLVVMMQDTFSFSFTRYILYVGAGVLAIADSGASWALRPTPAVDPRASLWLARAFVASIYTWSGIAKMRWPWVDGTTLGALHAGHFLRGRLVDMVTATAPARVATSLGVLSLELALGPLLLARRTRLFGLAMAVIMHSLYEVAAQPDVMALVMISLLSVFLPRSGEDRLSLRPFGSLPFAHERGDTRPDGAPRGRP